MTNKCNVTVGAQFLPSTTNRKGENNLAKQLNLNFNRIVLALTAAWLVPLSHQVAFAGPGLADSTNATGSPIKVPTYYVNSPSGLRVDPLHPVIDPVTGQAIPSLDTGTALRKFVDKLPRMSADGGATGANNLGQYIPIAVADTTTYPNSEYYEIASVEYTERVHSDLPKATTLRGYVQLETASNAATSKHIALTYPSGAPILDANGSQIFAFDTPHQLGPLISAAKGIAVRVKYVNLLPTGHYDAITKSRGGDLFLPVDKTLIGTGKGPNGTNEEYAENRAGLHLHGGDSPWISDGTPHQWITPAGEATAYPKGASVQNVPDMPDPGPGAVTMYYPNNQSARMMWFHDHTLGLTRLNVYGGMVGSYLLTDPTEQALISSGVIPAEQIPLIIQDKTFVPKDIALQDTKWDMDAWGKPGDLWFPHVYETNQDPNSNDGTNPPGRWDYGPWFWPVFPAPLPIPTGEYKDAAGVSQVSTTPEAFMDTPLVNGTAYPTMDVEPKAYRFRVLNAMNDRMINLGLYIADPTVTTDDGRTGTEVKMMPASPAAAGAALQNCPVDAQGNYLNVNAVTGLPVNCLPAGEWPIDGRDGGVPDPRTAGPKIIQIGTEGGFLPQVVEIPSTPINFEYNRRSVTVLNVLTHGLYLGSAERADIIIDFSQYAPGTKIIVYNDSPAPVPAFDPRIDYYTGNPDQSGVGGSESTKAGYGPNTRTVMQFVVGNAAPAAAFDTAALTTALPQAYAASQERPIVAEAGYNKAYGTTWADNYARIYTGAVYLGAYKPFNYIDGTTGLPAVAGNLATQNPLQAKAIQELFDPNYGRMNATLGVELPFTSALTQTTIPLGYVDPPTETVNPDQTQVWKITHNGVDVHPVHFHLYNVQLINRVGWDGTIKPPAPQELGWKETVKMNPLEDIIVALRPKKPILPGFGVPESIRPMDPTQPLGVTTGFTQVNTANGNPAVVSNVMNNYSWEYVWHCHILGHEENDFMRPVVFKVNETAPIAPAAMTAVANLQGVALAWTDASANEFRFDVMRAPANATGAATGAYAKIGQALANATTYVDATVSELTWYSYQVVAVSAGGTTASAAASVQTIALTVPFAPSGLAAVASSASQVNLSWVDNANNEASYQVARSVDAGATWVTIAPTLAVNAQSYVDANAAQNTSYQYRVSAANALGATTSNVASVTTPWAPAVAVTSLASVATSPTQVNLSWIFGGANATGFIVNRSANNGATWTPLAAALPANALSYSDAGALAGTSYQYQVITVNGANQSTPVVTSVTTPFASPAAPTSFTATAVGGTNVSIALAWVDPGTNVTGYVVQRCAGTCTSVTGPWTTLTTTAATVLSFADTTAAQNTTYSYKVYATNGTAQSAALVATATAPFADPAAPTSLAATANSATQVSLAWADTGTNVAGYVVQRCAGTCTAAGPWTTLTTTASGTLAFADSTTTGSLVYTYRVYAINGTLQSAAQMATVTTPAAVNVAAPTGLAGVLGVGSVALTWVDHANNETGFVVQRSTDGVNYTQIGTATTVGGVGGTRNYNDATAAPGNTYYYRVYAVNGVSYSAASNVFTVVSALPVVAAPSGLTSAISATQIALTWVDNATNETSFTVYKSTNGGAFAAAGTVAARGGVGGTRTFNDAAVVLGNTYQYYVVAVDLVNGVSTASPASATISVAFAAPAAPTGLAAAKGTAAGSIVVTWADASNNEAGFTVQRSVLNANGTTWGAWGNAGTVAAGTQTFTDTARTTGRTYRYQVRANNALGSSVWVGPTANVVAP
jgi:FtsP/CotA-like multicopper oxidase with cupredoxin domain/fibronectin type 3 domain-containing protein